MTVTMTLLLFTGDDGGDDVDDVDDVNDDGR